MQKIALVEDQRMILDMFAEWLESTGLVKIAGTFESAEFFLEWMEIAVARDPSSASLYLVTDLVMPTMSGHQLIPVVRERWPEVKIMAVTGAREPLLFQSVAGKVDAMVSKNGDSRAEILRGLRAMGMGRRYVSPSIAKKMAESMGNDGIPALERLTDREIDVMRRLFMGASLKAIAIDLGLASQSASDARTRVLRKLEPHTEFEIYTLFAAAGLLQTQ